MLNKTAVGNQIAILRRQKGYTQAVLAEKLGVTAQAVSKWENGHTLPETAMLPLLSEFLGSSIDVILRPEQAIQLKSIEEINKIDPSKLKDILQNKIAQAAIVKATMGVSPEIRQYLAETLPDIDFVSEYRKIGPVKVEEIEEIHARILAAVNASNILT